MLEKLRPYQILYWQAIIKLFKTEMNWIKNTDQEPSKEGNILTYDQNQSHFDIAYWNNVHKYWMKRGEFYYFDYNKKFSHWVQLIKP